MKKLNHLLLLKRMQDRLALLKNEIQSLENEIQELEEHGLEYPKEIYLVRNTVFVGLATRCYSCGDYVDLDNSILFCNQEWNGDYFCDKCANRIAPFLTKILVPWMHNYPKLFEELVEQYPKELLPLTESRVPVIMSWLNRLKNLKAFL